MSFLPNEEVEVEIKSGKRDPVWKTATVIKCCAERIWVRVKTPSGYEKRSYKIESVRRKNAA